MPFGVSLPELIILLVVLLLVFGAKRLPEMGRSLGKGMREFKDSVSGIEEAVTTTTPTSTTAPTTPTRVELPSATSAPDAPSGESEARSERETVS
jgi:TatA/E family protein of Tat protein translocase